jgi:hypothetical protein
MISRLSLLLVLAAVPAAAAPLRYNRDVRPVLSDNCFHCHGPDAKTRKADLRLDLREAALVPAKSGKPAIVPGKPDASELVTRIFHTDPDELMPPEEAHKVLTPEQKDMFRRWVAEGAAYEAHWAYTPVVRPAVPKLDDKHALIANPIDVFIQQPLLEKNIAPSPEAGAATLQRRLSLDLAGLPPPEKTPESYAAAVDRLLASPQYGERMAQHWLDVVRYADTVGFHGDQNHNAWAYRDWVVSAFNDNKRFDAFTREQLAGDLLPQPTEDQYVATCFNRLTMMTREGGAQPGEYLAKYSADRVRTVSMAWLGATVGCAECHDHKFDPWSQKDFYSLAAYFADVKQWGVYQDYTYTPNPDLKGWSNDHPFPPERVVESEALKRRIASLQAQRDKVLHEAAEALKNNAPALLGFSIWGKTFGDFLKENPNGWRTPVPLVEEKSPAPPRKGKAKPAPAPAVEAAVVQSDGRILFAKGGARHTEITLPVSGNVCSVSIELLPDKTHNNSVARSGHSVTLKPSFHLVSADGTTRPLPVRFAEANLKRGQYANGFEVMGIQNGWTSRDGSAHVPHRSLWLLAEPVAFAAGDSLRVALPDNLAGCLRVSFSPIITSFTSLDPFPEFSGPLDEASVHRYYLLSSPGHAVQQTVYALDQQIRECRGGRTPVMVTERLAKPLVTRLLPRGNWQDESGALCSPVTPSFLPKDPQAEPTRLGLAHWLTSRENPLTARVIMNRLWRQFFGTGLSAQTDDLGAQGEAPSHPELLDWLAAEFMESGWDLKHMVRLIVMSHTYRQSSQPRPETREADPQNRWLASQNARRLEAEAVRDNALAIAGLLNLEIGGPPVHPYQPAGYYEGLQFPDRDYIADQGRDQWRRGIYTHWQRTFLQPMLANFDAPSREDCVALRTQANTPQQALTLLNDPSYVEAARVWAVEIMKAGDDAVRINAAFQKALSRKPSDKEREGLLTFLDRMRAEYKARPEDAAKLLKIGYAPLPPDSADKVELAAWTSVCRVVLNLHETITRY